MSDVSLARQTLIDRQKPSYGSLVGYSYSTCGMVKYHSMQVKILYVRLVAVVVGIK